MVGLERINNMTLEKLKKMLADEVITQDEYKELLTKFNLEDDEPEPDLMSGFDEKTKEYIQKLLQSERDRAANRVGNRKKAEYEALKADYEKLKNERLSEEEKRKLEDETKRKDLERKEKEFALMQCKYIAAQELKTKGLDNSDEVVQLVLGSDEDDTKKRVSAFAQLIDKLVKAKVEERFKESGRDVQRGSLAGGEYNPWAKGSINITKQFEIESADPERAKALKAAAKA